MSKISIIVPVYNVEKYLHRCVDSILNQTFEDFELILVDDGSKDCSGKICDEYAEKDNRVKVIHKENCGVSSARNTGIENATGEYVMFVDSDDYIDSNMLECMSEQNFYNYSDIVFSGLKFVDKDDSLIKNNVVQNFLNIKVSEYIEKYFIFMEENCISYGPYNKLFKNDIMKKFNIKFDESISICEDGLFVVEYLKKSNNITNIEKSFYNYVQYNSGNLMTRYNDNATEACLKLYRSKLDFITRTESNKQQKKYIDECCASLMLSFFVQIYSRSRMNFVEKYFKIKSVLEEDDIRNLLLHLGKKGFKSFFFKSTIKMRQYWLLNLMACFVWK